MCGLLAVIIAIMIALAVPGGLGIWGVPVDAALVSAAFALVWAARYRRRCATVCRDSRIAWRTTNILGKTTRQAESATASLCPRFVHARVFAQALPVFALILTDGEHELTVAAAHMPDAIEDAIGELPRELQPMVIGWEDHRVDEYVMQSAF